MCQFDKNRFKSLQIATGLIHQLWKINNDENALDEPKIMIERREREGERKRKVEGEIYRGREK